MTSRNHMVSNVRTSELPQGWEVVKLPEVCHLNPGKPDASKLRADTQVTFVPMAAVDADSGQITRPIVRPHAEVSKGFTAFQENDVIMAKITPCMENGKAAIARGLSNGIGFGSTEFHVFRHSKATLPEYLFYFIRQDSFRKSAEANMTGSVGQKRVPVDFLRDTILPVAPLNEQHRIVAKLEKLLSRVDAAQARLATIPIILKRFRQSVLAAACSGHLTTDWRQRNSISADWTSAQLLEVSELIQIGPFGTQVHKADYMASGIPLINPTHIQGNRIVHDSTFSVSRTKLKELANYILQEDDIIMGRRGEMGRCALVSEKESGWLCGTGSLFIRSNSSVHPAFLFLILRNGETKAFLENESKGTTMSNLNLEILKRVPVSHPKLAEQQEIVHRVEALFKTADALEARYRTAKAHVNKLTQSILARAFRGQLVPQDPNDEPASVLLARLSHAGAQSERKPKRPRNQAAPAAPLK